MYDEDFRKRLTELRLNKKVSARDMSLSIGQNQNYINNIENGKTMPSMSAFLFICDYLKVTPSEFFDTENKQPDYLRNTMQSLKKLDNEKLNAILNLINIFTK